MHLLQCALLQGAMVLEPARAPQGRAGSSIIGLAGFHGFSLAAHLGQAHGVCAGIAWLGAGSIRKGLLAVSVDLGGVPGPLFLGRSNPLAMKCARRGLLRPFYGALVLSTLFVENGPSGLFRAFPGAPWRSCRPSWAYLIFGVIPAPLWALLFGAVRRVCAGALGFPVRVALCEGFMEGIGGEEANYFRALSGRKKQLLQGLCEFHTLLDYIELKCLGRRQFMNQGLILKITAAMRRKNELNSCGVGEAWGAL